MNMLRVRVALSPPDTNRATMISSKLVMKASRALETTAKRICGKVITMKARKRLAPRLRATISWFMS